MIETKNIPKTYATVVLLAFIIVIVIGIQMTSYIVNILLLSLIMTMLAYPCVSWVKKRGLPDIAAVGIITGVALLLILGMIILIITSLQQLIIDLPLYQAELQERLADFFLLLDKVGIDKSVFTHPDINLQSVAVILSSSMFSIGEAVMYLFFIGVTTFFALLEAPHIPERIRRVFGGESQSLKQFGRMSKFTIDFVVVRTQANAVHGFLFGSFLFVMGVHSAILWGIMTFILGYIPYIGLIIAALPALFFAWLQFGTWGVIAVAAAVVVLNILVENPIYAHLAAKKFEMPALIVILSLIFWSWTLGIAGLVFAVPITLLVLIVFQSSKETCWINTMLGVDKIFEEIAEGDIKTDTIMEELR